MAFRIGHGFDVHKFDIKEQFNKKLVLGGVEINYPYALVAHSDGDVVLHALCDALLGAIGAGDIGEHFPDNDINYQNIDSRILLQKTMALIVKQGYKINNVDITIIAQIPKLTPYKQDIKNLIASDLSVSSQQVNIKATTTEGLGYIGRKEGIAAHVVALLVNCHE